MALNIPVWVVVLHPKFGYKVLGYLADSFDREAGKTSWFSGAFSQACQFDSELTAFRIASELNDGKLKLSNPDMMAWGNINPDTGFLATVYQIKLIP